MAWHPSWRRGEEHRDPPPGQQQQWEAMMPMPPPASSYPRYAIAAAPAAAAAAVVYGSLPMPAAPPPPPGYALYYCQPSGSSCPTLPATAQRPWRPGGWRGGSGGGGTGDTAFRPPSHRPPRHYHDWEGPSPPPSSSYQGKHQPEPEPQQQHRRRLKPQKPHGGGSGGKGKGGRGSRGGGKGKGGGRDEWPLERTPAFSEDDRDHRHHHRRSSSSSSKDGGGGGGTVGPSLPFLARTDVRPTDLLRAAALGENVARVLESLHLVAPFLAPADLLRLSGVSRGWTRAYRGAVGELRVGKPPPGRGSGHWTGLLTLLATVKGLRALQVAHPHALFPLGKCLGFRVTDRLASLDLSYLRISRSDETRLLAALGDGCTPSLTSLLLVHAGLADRGCELLAAALRRGGLRRLRELDLSLNNIRRGVRELGAAVVAPGCVPELRALVLAGNPLGREGVGQLMEGLATALNNDNDPSSSTQPPSLRIFNLVECALDPDGGCAALCHGLALLGAGPTGPLWRLRSLQLNANNLGDAGLAALAAALHGAEDGDVGGGGCCPYLRELGFGANYVTDEGVATLVAGGLLRRLRRLNLAFNFVTADGARALAGAWHAASGVDEGGGDGGDDDEEEEEGEEGVPTDAGCVYGGGSGGRRPRRRHPSRRALDLYQNEVRGRERTELQEEMREHFPGVECTL